MAERTPEQKARQAGYMRKRREDPEYRAQKAEYMAKYQVGYMRKRRYGLTPEQHAAMAESQGDLCAICKRRRTLVVDHCHETGVVRGLLCDNCNVGIGRLGDDPARLAAAAKYIRDSRKRQQLPLGIEEAKHE